MSDVAKDLLEFIRLKEAGDGVMGALLERLMRATAVNLIAPGVADMRGGC